MPIPLWKGKDSKIIFSFLEKKLILDVTDWEVGREGEEVEDDICGEDRARLDFVTSHFSITMNSKQQKLDAVDAFIAEQKSRDIREIPKQSSVGFLIFPNDGTSAAYQARGYTLDKWKFGAGARKERNKLSIPGRCQYFDKLPTL